MLRLQHGSNVSSKTGHGRANEHRVPGVVYCHIEVQASKVSVMPNVRIGLTTGLTSITIIYVGMNLQQTFTSTGTCKVASTG